MSKHRKARISIGLHMPGWLPEHLHMPARLALGLVLGGCFAGYAVALAVVVSNLIDLDGSPAAEIGNLALLIIGAFALRAALIRWCRGFGHE
jgi:hypothetical protein